MRLLAISIICLARLLSSAETAGDGEAIPEEPILSISERINIISLDMWALHDDLRDERHGKVIEIQSEAIRKSIQKLIDDAEEKDLKQQQNKANGAGLKDSKSTSSDDSGRVKPSTLVWNPKTIRNTHIDLAKPIIGPMEGIPERWRERLKAYFISVAAEEAEALIKCRTTTPKKK